MFCHAMNYPAASPSDSAHLEYIARLPSVSSSMVSIDDAVTSQGPVTVCEGPPSMNIK